MAKRTAAPAVRLADAVKAAKKRLPIKPTRALNQILDFAAGDKAEAYRLGAEEAQREIVTRLSALTSAPADGSAHAGSLEPTREQVAALRHLMEKRTRFFDTRSGVIRCVDCASPAGTEHGPTCAVGVVAALLARMGRTVET